MSVKVVDGEYFMISSEHSIFEGFIFKITRLRDYRPKVNKWRRTLSFKTESEAIKCYTEMRDADGIELQRVGGKVIKVRVPHRLIEHIE